MTAPAKAAPMREDVTQADRARVILAISKIERDVRVSELTDNEIDTLILASRHRLAHTARPDAGDGTWGPITEWEMINRLRDEEADTVTVLCDNPQGPPNNAVECCGFWTGFADRRFEGATIREALTAAVAAKDEASKVGYPPMSRPDAGDEDVERVARAIMLEQCKQATAEEMEGFTPEQVAEHAWSESVPIARAALAAMREGVDRGMVERCIQIIEEVCLHPDADVNTIGLLGVASSRIQALAALSPEQRR